MQYILIFEVITEMCLLLHNAYLSFFTFVDNKYAVG